MRPWPKRLFWQIGTNHELEKVVDRHTVEMKQIFACPKCGTEVLHHCFHDDDEVFSIEMSVEAALRLRLEWIAELESEIESARDEVKRYEAGKSEAEWYAKA